ncbi:MAG: helix-turn-helix domain-containing protein, partial [Halobacteriales archaeon]|nr:helix-turn-helix domain-containing protein [Halobacteriales archaeon]
WCEGEDWCPITATATLLGRKWHPVILHRLLEHDRLGYNELLEEVDGISSKVLSESLEHLEDHGLVDRTVVSERPFRVEYTLTSAGESTEPIIQAMGDWGSEYLTTPTEEWSTRTQ